MSLIEGPTGGPYDATGIVRLTSKPSTYGALTGKYSNQAKNAKTNSAVTKIGAVKGHYDPQLMAMLAGELV